MALRDAWSLGKALNAGSQAQCAHNLRRLTINAKTDVRRSQNRGNTLAIPWIAALKVIPWTEVLKAAPGIVKGAKRLFASKKDDLARQPTDVPTTETFPADVDRVVHLANRIGQIQAQVVELSNEQKSSAELIRSLAEQNAKVVEAIDVLRIRTRMFLLATIVLAGALVALVAWVATK